MAFGAALFVLIPQQVKVTDADLTRVIQGLVAGVGFLGAGAVIRIGDQAEVIGLTTAAGIWLTAAIGQGSENRCYSLPPATMQVTHFGSLFAFCHSILRASLPAFNACPMTLRVLSAEASACSTRKNCTPRASSS